MKRLPFKRRAPKSNWYHLALNLVFELLVHLNGCLLCIVGPKAPAWLMRSNVNNYFWAALLMRGCEINYVWGGARWVDYCTSALQQLLQSCAARVLSFAIYDEVVPSVGHVDIGVPEI
eukprot:1147887-Pelagomonas_calceolata.AAC.6